MRQTVRLAFSIAALFVSLVLLTICAARAGEDQESDAGPAAERVQKRFVGNYRLLSFFRYPVRGEPVEVKMIGRIMYDGHGNMAAQLQPNGFKSLAGDAEARGRRGGYVAYFGRYEIDADENRVTHKVIGANIPAWAGDENDFGNDNVRFFEFDGDRLKLSLKDRSGRVTGTLTWQRFQ